jgi:dTDP-4-amino-4,6-dideoxygalactose transaminase
MKYSVDKPVRDSFLVFGSPQITEREIEAVVQVMKSRWIGAGPRVMEFEEAFRKYAGTRYAVAVNSCTAALHLSMISSGIGAGDEVITTPMTFCATINAIIHTGARPVFVDVDPVTMNIDPAGIERALTERTRAILPVHFAGRPCEMERILALAAHNNCLVIEDAAHAIEGRRNGVHVGNIGDIGCFSFYVTKNLFTGEGGMITTNDRALADTARIFALHGMSHDAWRRYSDAGFKHYDVIGAGFKYNMMDLQAAIGLEQMPFLEQRLERRVAIWERYQSAFSDLPLLLPAAPEPETVHARHLYAVRLECERVRCCRDEFIGALYRENIGTGVHYRSAHVHPFYRTRYNLTDEQFPASTRISQTTFSLPLSAALSDRDVDDVIEAVHRVAAFYAK